MAQLVNEQNNLYVCKCVLLSNLFASPKKQSREIDYLSMRNFPLLFILLLLLVLFFHNRNKRLQVKQVQSIESLPLLFDDHFE